MLVKRIEMNELSSTSINESMIEQQIFSVLSLWYAAKTHLTKLKESTQNVYANEEFLHLLRHFTCEIHDLIRSQDEPRS